MRALLALVLALYVGSASAHVMPIPYADVGSLRDITHQTALGTVGGRTSVTVPQIFYNIVTDAGATCNGDVVTVTRTTSITSGTKNLSVSVNTFSSGDAGKAIVIPGAGGGGGNYFGTIATFTDAQHVVLSDNASTTLSSASTAVTYGHDDAPNFATFNTWAIANQGATNQVVLTIPNGANCWFGSSVGSGWAASINNLLVEGTGATISGLNGWGFQLGGTGVCQRGITDVNGCSARIQSVSTGATQVTLTAASFSAGYISRFSVGRWVMLGGLNTQALWNSPFGYPQNLQYFEWRQITGVNAGTGVITLDRALSNSYLSTWPLYNDGNAFEADSAGPATIFAVGGASNNWNSTVEYRGLTISQDGQTYAQGRNVTYRNVTFTGAHGGIPTQNETWSAINTSMAAMNMETDKLVGVMTMDGVTIDQIKFQSSSTDRLIMRNSTVTNNLTGTAKRTDITDSTLASFSPGAYAYGISPGPVVCTRCAVASFTDGGILQNTDPPYSMTSGVISFPNTSASGSGPAERIFVPGGNVYWAPTGYYTVGLFQTGAMTQDATNVYVQTSEAGSFPTLTATPVYMRTHPAPQFTCDACTGDPRIVAVSLQAGATPLAPLGSYARLSFAPTSAQGNLGNLPVRGKIASMTIDVTQAYSGSGSATLAATGQFHSQTVKQSNWTAYDWVPSINLKQTGTRVITPSGVTCNGSPGACAGDGCIVPASGCYALPEAVWIVNGFDPYMGSTLSAGTQPQFTITITTDQGVVNP